MEDTRQGRGSPILVIEDDAGYADLLRAWLERAWSQRVEVVWAPSLHEACSQLETSTPACVLLDLGLPDATGLEALEKVLEVAPRAPVVVVTGCDDEALGIEALELGAQDFVVKGDALATLLGRSVRYAIERHQAEERLRESERQFRLLAENAQDFIFRYRVGPHPGFDYASPASLAVTGYSPAELYADPGLVMQLVGDDHRAAMDHLARSEELARPWEVQVVRKDGSVVWIEQRLTAVRGDGGELEAIEGIVRDITERKQVNEQLLHHTLHDPLTGLANRTLLYDRLHHALAQSEREHGQTGVLFLDLDNFKQINDEHGHRVGDELLAALGDRLQAAVRPADTVARIGGDEFLVVYEHADEPGALALADRLETAIGAPVAAGGVEHRLSASIGIALGDGDAEELVRAADAAVYRAKAAGGARVEVFG